MLIAIVNNSTLVSNDDVAIMCAAIKKQMTLHLAPAWNQVPAIVTFYPDESKVPGHAWKVKMLDNPDVPNALGYHSEDNDKICAYIFCKPVLDNHGVVLFDENNPQNVSVSSVLSHEVCEMFIDRFANLWVDGPTISRCNQFALEICDPVESDSYEIDVKYKSKSYKVSVSNFIFPSWINQQSTDINKPFDYLKKLNAPFTMSAGGYMILRNPSGKEISIFGKAMPKWKVAIKKADFYRR